ncbi:MAG: hypothetical protein A2508_04145 [Candidatus Lambdaproteobacteria bacterium RIFOXYD12_FULL_49_8]|uniref:DUF374 domain-containing protein n=1 Tax=Candidatus Lambdaproteobacteria bacterium RIFOXYD2_FULL_50_16 TaxID=1817772 RepID=A0A1F6G9R2_9PROT|nr:MAG: hypothetical protein A2527_13010 [Candidatus Lambdaproteobacteria bacterium RIFOXYD2_FULL_50_16]OGG98174.1 MAG: hypothetical protein A2508_04145 [Candidatus Lambdaproteobacteria bacterium RIFOXYD12_FULL_49_8]
MSQRSIKKRVKFWLGPKVIKGLLVWAGTFSRQVTLGVEHIRPFEESGEPFIYSMWHCDVTLATWVLRGRGLKGLVSDSEDGELAAKTIESMGNGVIRGSSSKGGAKALLEAIKWCKSGGHALITPDGPRGPAQVAQSGAVNLAAKTGLPLMPLYIEGTKQRIFEKSWDRHLFPKAFSTLVVGYGAPLYVPNPINVEEVEIWTNQLETAMSQTKKQVQTYLNQLKENP